MLCHTSIVIALLMMTVEVYLLAGVPRERMFDKASLYLLVRWMTHGEPQKHPVSTREEKRERTECASRLDVTVGSNHAST